jgi:hypothetical protein
MAAAFFAGSLLVFRIRSAISWLLLFAFLAAVTAFFFAFVRPELF